jgi:hypothetical protein
MAIWSLSSSERCELNRTATFLEVLNNLADIKSAGCTSRQNSGSLGLLGAVQCRDGFPIAAKSGSEATILRSARRTPFRGHSPIVAMGLAADEAAKLGDEAVICHPVF